MLSTWDLGNQCNPVNMMSALTWQFRGLDLLWPDLGVAVLTPVLGPGAAASPAPASAPWWPHWRRGDTLPLHRCWIMHSPLCAWGWCGAGGHWKAGAGILGEGKGLSQGNI